MALFFSISLDAAKKLVDPIVKAGINTPIKEDPKNNAEALDNFGSAQNPLDKGANQDVRSKQ